VTEAGADPAPWGARENPYDEHGPPGRGNVRRDRNEDPTVTWLESTTDDAQAHCRPLHERRGKHRKGHQRGAIMTRNHLYNQVVL